MRSARTRSRKALQVIKACLLAGVLALFMAQADAGRLDSRAWFDADGTPTPDGQAYMKRFGLPRLISGQEFYFPDHEAIDGQGGCVILQFSIDKDGVTNRFIVLDSRPKGVFDQAVLETVKEWQFAPPEQGLIAMLLPVHFAFTSDSRHPRYDRGDSQCVSPKSEVQAMNIRGEVTQAEKPFYPPLMVDQRIQGCVTVSFDIGADGLADNYEMLDGQPGNEFFKATVQALNKSRFAPREGKQDRSWVVFRYYLPELKAEESRPCHRPDDKLESNKSGATP